jgi:hypothetical protein
MSFRFYRRVHVLPELSLNISKSGPSVTLGVRGAHLTLGRKGITKTIGLPGTGIYYTSRSGYHTGYHSAHDMPATTTPLEISHQPIAGWVLVITIVVIALLIGIGIGSLHAE